MSILNVHDIERDISIIEDGYGRAIQEYGDVGGILWTAMWHALANIGFRYEPAARSYFDGQIRNPHNNLDDYNFQEITQWTNQWLYSNGYNMQMSFDWFEILMPDWVKFIGKFWTMDVGTGSAALKPGEFNLYYNINNIQQPLLFGR